MGCAFGSAIYCDTGRARIRPLQEEVIVMYETTIQLNAINDVKDFVNKVIDAKSIMGIFSLDLSKPIKLQAHTDDADKLVEAIGKYIVK